MEKKIKLRKAEIGKFTHAVRHIREAMEEGEHDPLSAMYCAGITMEEEIRRFMHYAEITGAHDVVDAVAFKKLETLMV